MSSTQESSPYDVFISGAGPAGMALAIFLKLQGVSKIKIINKSSGIAPTSRAAGVHARTVELYRQIGVADELVAKAYGATEYNFWSHGRNVGTVDIGAAGLDVTPYHYQYNIAQNVHEEILYKRCQELGISIDYDTTLESFEDRGSEVSVQYSGVNGRESCKARFIVGADGAHSAVRHILGLGFPGAAYEHLCFLADVKGHGRAFDGANHVAIDGVDFITVFPYDKEGVARIVGVVDPLDREKPVTFEDVRERVHKYLDVRVDEVNWFSAYHLHHRKAETFRVGRAFLVGDAAHIHSPMGAQGLNTGINDASNLAWKIAAALRGQGSEIVLESFREEREEFATALLANTHRIFTTVTGVTWLSWLQRCFMVLLVATLLNYIPSLQKKMFRTISQTGYNYRTSKLSQGQAGSILAGDRLPWVPSKGGDNYGAYKKIEWSVQVFGQATSQMQAYCDRVGLTLHEMPFTLEAEKAGFARDAVYLVRPDLYVACADARGEVRTLENYFRSRDIVLV